MITSASNDHSEIQDSKHCDENIMNKISKHKEYVVKNALITGLNIETHHMTPPIR